jgi:class 3 adenylate cyclase
MPISSDLRDYAIQTFGDWWIPGTDDIALKNDGVRLDASIVYADLASSTALVQRKRPEFAAEVYKTYLYGCSKLIRHHGGAVTAFDGDRVMGVFLGDSRSSNAGKCALRISLVREAGPESGA